MISEARKRAGLTQVEIARKLDTDQVTYKAFEKNIVEPPSSVLRRIAHLLNIDPKEIQDTYTRYRKE